MAKRSGNDRHDENVVQSIRGKCAGQTERIAELNMGQQAGNNPKNEVPHREAQEPLMVRHDLHHARQGSGCQLHPRRETTSSASLSNSFFRLLV